MLKDDRHKAGVNNLAVAHIAGVVQLLLKHACRWFVRLGGEVDHETLGPRCQTTKRLAQHVFRACDLAKQVQLVNQCAD